MDNNQLSFFREEAPKKRKFEFSADKLILAVIFFIVCIIISYSIGIETGKSIKLSEIKAEQAQFETPIDMANIQKDLLEKEIPTNTKPKKTGSKSAENKISGTQQPPVQDNEPKPGPFYTVQIATYSNEKFAKKKAEELKKEGLASFLIKKGKYEVLYVGKLEDKSAAQKQEQALKKKYPDCLVKKIKGGM